MMAKSRLFSIQLANPQIKKSLIEFNDEEYDAQESSKKDEDILDE